MSFPFVVWNDQTVPENGFGSFVVHSQTICDGIKAGGGCHLGANSRAVHHERCVCASLAFYRPEESESSNRLYGSDVVQR